ncbi:DUF551 domain-containing protein [Salmonella enterica subsp. enterica serovar Manhattan]|nr:DUF551 domain-containing protein [Salmonella enterica subsp. enterica serovar Manhattan]
MITITKERLLTIKQWRETYGPGSNVVLPAEEAEELARIALASLEADPVAYIFKHPAGKLFWSLTDESNKEQADVIPVYAAAPASVVPDNASEPLAYAYKELTPEIMRNQAAESNRGNEWTGNPDIDNAIIMLDRIDTLENCDDDRIEAVKAVLRRLAGNYPVTPDGWISCSERMPKKNQNVLISVNFDSDLVEPLICSARYTGSTFRRGQATIKPGNGIEQATHWMPLPEPPQEAK